MNKSISVTEKKLKVEPNFNSYDDLVNNFSFDNIKDQIEYFTDGGLNIAHNAIYRHLESTPDKTALIWIGADFKRKEFSFFDLAAMTSKFGELLKEFGVSKGDRVFFFASRVPEVYYGFLGTLKIGAIAGTLFGAFKENALKDRLISAKPKVIVTNRELLPRIEAIKDDLEGLTKILLVEEIETLLSGVRQDDKCESMNEDDFAFMMYTSGTEGYIDSVMHGHGALLQQQFSAKVALDLKENDVYWCSADPGWVTGVVYGIISNLSLGVTSVVFDGRFDTKDWLKLIKDNKITVWYTAPTALRMLMADLNFEADSLSSLRHVCTVGEPLNPEVIRWFYEKTGLVLHDTWWQTETGSICIANLACFPTKLGSMGKAMPGIEAFIVDENFTKLSTNQNGRLAIKKGWPSMMKGIFENELRYNEFFKGDLYVTNDEMYQDGDGYFWFVGRDDEIIKTSGERVGSFEVESALLEHESVKEVGVIGKPDDVRGQIIKACVVLKENIQPREELKDELASFVKEKLAAHAYPREIVFVSDLPKTNSGKIIRKQLLDLNS